MDESEGGSQGTNVLIPFWDLPSYRNDPAIAVTFLAAFAIAIGTAGCGDNQAAAGVGAGRDDYALGFYNATKDQELRDVEITWVADGVRHIAGGGLLVPDPDRHGMGTLNEGEPRPIPQRVTLTWRGPDGKAHSRVMEVAPKVPEPFTGIVYFKYTGHGPDEGWRVIPLSYAQREQLAEQGKPIIPPDPPQTAVTTRAAPAAAAGHHPTTRPAKAEAATRPSSERGGILDAAKFVHLIMMRPELLPLGDYCESPDPATQRYIRACSRLASAAHALRDSVKTKFGDKPLDQLQLVLPDAATVLKEGWQSVREAHDPLPDELDHATVDVQGERATIRAGGESIPLRRVGSRWKVVVPSLAQLAANEGLAGNPDADPNKMARDAERVAIIDERLAIDVRAGQFQTADQVVEARARRRAAAGDLLRQERDGTAPTTSPAVQ